MGGPHMGYLFGGLRGPPWRGRKERKWCLGAKEEGRCFFRRVFFNKSVEVFVYKYIYNYILIIYIYNIYIYIYTIYILYIIYI